MKTKLILAALMASAVVAQATPAITPAKVKAPLHIGQIKGVFHKIAQKPSAAPVAPGGQKVAAAGPFLNHPESAPGPH
ncbi:MAG: hypothetical protein B7Z37_01405 [Verrucomicrobia bacterium 12-59-8]|nr:MAG: hypothetical protein B7Z37_01405 [Verrucomicrobia bacterium 12-59-8]